MQSTIVKCVGFRGEKCGRKVIAHGPIDPARVRCQQCSQKRQRRKLENRIKFLGREELLALVTKGGTNERGRN